MSSHLYYLICLDTSLSNSEVPESVQHIKQENTWKETCRIISVEQFMHNPSEISSDNAATTAKSRGKKKKTVNFRSPLEAADKSLINYKPNRRQSIPEEWDQMGSNFRVDTRAFMTQKSPAAMPEIHHGIANSSMPIPLNTIMNTWKNVPKLHQYQPADLQVVYHRRTGEVETITSVDSKKPSMELPFQNHAASNHLIQPSLPPQQSSTYKSFDDKVQISKIPSELTNRGIGSKHSNALPNNEKLPIQGKVFTSSECQTVITMSRSTSCQKDVEVNTVNVQTEALDGQFQSFFKGHIRKKCEESQTLTQGATIATQTSELYPTNSSNRYYQCRSSQTEAFKLHLSSQSACASAQTNLPPECISRAAETEKIYTSIAAVQVSINVLTNDAYSQTEIDIETTPKVCMECECKQFQVDELEEKVDELRCLLKIKEKEFESTLEACHRIPTVYEDASTETNNYDPVDVIARQIYEEELQRRKVLEQENMQLKITAESLKTQLHCFQHGLTRLRTAIEKPVITEDFAISEAAIQEALHKADDFILNYSSAESRAMKINDHLSVLNSCVSVANGILEDKPK